MKYTLSAVLTKVVMDYGVTVDQLNNAVATFKYDKIARHNGIPTSNPFTWHNGRVKIHASGSQVRTMGSRIHLILKSIKFEKMAVFFGSRVWFCFVILLKISATLMSPLIYEEDLVALDGLILKFLQTCVSLFGLGFIRPKFHSLVHYSTQIRSKSFFFFFI